MKTTRVLAAALLVLPLSLAPAFAQSKPDPRSLLGYFQRLKDALSQSAVAGQRKKARGAAVAAVRGADQSSELADPDRPALKGDVRARRARRAAAEDAELAKAAELVLTGKTAEGVKALEAFKAAHPKSPRLKLADEALLKARELAAQPAPAPAKG